MAVFRIVALNLFLGLRAAATINGDVLLAHSWFEACSVVMVVE